MQFLRKSPIVLLIILCLSIKVKGQVQIFEKNSIEKIKNGTTHVVVKDVHFPHSDEFLAVFKKYWTLSKGVDIISVDDFEKGLAAGETYFSLSGLTIKGGGAGASIYNYLDLWVPSEKSLKKDRKFKITDEISIAHIPLSIDVETVTKEFKGGKAIDFDFDGGGHIYHWNPGLLKNYLQQLTAQLLTGKKVDFHDDFIDKAKLEALKTKTLYCPADNLNKMGTLVKVGKMVDVKDVFEDYKFKYEVITDAELGQKIIDDSEVIYYLIFLRNSTSKLIAVVNSRTGEIIYSQYHQSMTIPNLKDGDVKDLYKAVNKN
jgi:hypothetical protein